MQQLYLRRRQALAKHGGAQVLLKNILRGERAKAHANELYKEGKYAEALDAYSDALAIDKLNAAVNAKLYCNRANCHVKLSQWEEAAAGMHCAMELGICLLISLLGACRCWRGDRS